MPHLAAMLGCLGALLLMMGVGVGVGPANASQGHRHHAHQGRSAHVTPGVRFHDPDCQDPSASWRGFVSGSDRGAATFRVTAGAAAPGKQVTVTATARAGTTFAGGARTRTFTHTFDSTPSGCGAEQHNVIHAWVRFTNPSSDHDASWTGYVDGHADSATDHVTFQVTSGTVAPGATVTITATAEAGYTFAGGKTTETFTHTFCQAPTGDESVLHAWVRFTEATSGNGPSWTGYVNGHADSATDHVTFQVTSGTVAPGATVTITATAEAGYTFAGGKSTETFTHTFCQVGSSDTTVLHPWVQFTEATAAHGPSWTGYVNWVPDNATDHVSFQVTSGTVAPGATVTITATAESGYTFPHGETTMTFTHTFCQVGSNGTTSLVANVVFTNGTNGQGLGWTGFVNGVQATAGDHVTFQVTSGSVTPGATVVITATAATGYTLQGGEQSVSFTHTFPTVSAGHTSAGHTSSGGTSHAVNTGVSAGVSAGTGAGVSAETAAGVSAGTASSGGSTMGVSAAEAAVPTSINAGLAGEPETSTPFEQLARGLFAGGALLLLLSGWLMARGARPGAHRA